MIIMCLVEGNSIRGTARITDTSKDTVLKLLCDAGKVCKEYQNKYLVNLPCTRLECDELWSIVYCKERTENKRIFDTKGAFWTWTALCSDTKLIPCWHIGKRDSESAFTFIRNLKKRLSNRVQITTDGLDVYIEAIKESFGHDVDYSMLIKLYNRDGSKDYNKHICTSVKKDVIIGNPNPSNISTSFCERNNLTMRMSMRRYVRKTSGFSKKLENMEHALALYFMYYNFCRIHQSLRMTPAMKAGVSKKLWEIEDIITLII